ncbi:MAG: hypothetical protein ACR2JF_17945 [Iamia sp.]
MDAVTPRAPDAPDDRVDPGESGVAPAPPPTEPPTVALGWVSLGAAAASLVFFAVAAVLLALPVRTPDVQDCGAPAAYLYDGRVDVIPDVNDQILGPDDQPLTLDPGTAEVAREEPCQARVADRAVPALVLVLVGTVVGLAAFALEILAVRPRRRQAWRRAVVAGQAPPPPSVG